MFGSENLVFTSSIYKSETEEQFTCNNKSANSPFNITVVIQKIFK